VDRYEERLNPIFDGLAEAERRTGVANGKNGRNPLQRTILERIDSALSFTETLVRQVDPSLVSASRIAQIQTTIDEIQTTVEAFDPESAPDLEPADQAVDRLLDTAAALPHRPIEDAAGQGKAVAKSFQRSARQRERAVRSDLDSVRAQAVELGQKVESAKGELSATVDERTSALEARAAEIGSQLEAAEQGQSQLLDEQREAFQKMQEELRSDFDQKRDDQFGELSQQREDANTRLQASLETHSAAAEEVIEDLKRKDADAEELVGSISVRGTADRYEREAKTQGEIADRWRRVTVVIGLLAGLVAGSAAFLSDQEPAHIAGKIAVGVLLAGVAGYTARQSAQHRQREERASKLHLDLAAFGPFIEPLPEEAKNEERILLGRRVFARDEDTQTRAEHGTSLQALIPRRSGSPQKENDGQ
jgi:hypothetical protein